MITARHKRELVPKEDETNLVPQAASYDAFDLDLDGFEESNQHRWLMTTSVVGIAALLMIGTLAVGFFSRNASPSLANASVGDQQVLAERDLSGGFAYPEVKQADLPYSKENTQVLDADIKSVSDDGESFTTITKTPPPEPVDETLVISPNSNLVREMTNRGVSKATAEALAASIDTVVPSSQIKPGTSVDVTFDRQIDFYGREVTFPVEVSFEQPGKGTVLVTADEDGQFTAALDTPDSVAKPGVAAATAQAQFHTVSDVGASLYATAQDKGIPDYIVAEFTHVFSYDVDFQRQVGAADKFEVFYGNPLSGSSSKRKVLHLARLTIDGDTRTFYRFTTTDGLTDYYDENGHSASRTLLRTPVSGAHLTSGFGMRIHPLLGYSKMHTGVDFGAPFGTPIHAAGDGEIDQAGRDGGYGNAIVITHNDHLQTLYGHMSRFAAGIREGVHVNQGQVIGYIGSTGRSTGPHLHFEVRIDDRPVNPMSVRGTGGRQLTGKDLVAFRAQRDKIIAMMEKPANVAQASDTQNTNQ